MPTSSRCAPQERLAKAYADEKIQPDLVPVATRSAEAGYGLATADQPPRPGTTLEGIADLQDPVPAARPDHRGQRLAAHGRRHRVDPLASAEVVTELGLSKKMSLVGFAFAASTPR